MPTVEVQRQCDTAITTHDVWSMDASRRMSDQNLRGLSREHPLKEDPHMIPYCTDARGKAAVRDIVHTIAIGEPRKIGAPLILEAYPHLSHEVVPSNLTPERFGKDVTPNPIRGSGPWNRCPATTTVPVFICWSWQRC